MPNENLDTAESALRARLILLLASLSVQKINFRLGPYHISGWGFHMVIGLLRTISISVVIDPDAVAIGAEAFYSHREDKFVFRNSKYGASLEEKGVLLHESVHALIDSRGHKKVEDEAAAHVAEALYILNSKDYTRKEVDNLFEVAIDIAAKIKRSRDAVPVVSQDDLDDLILDIRRQYKAAGVPIPRNQPDPANGIANPMSIISPLYGWRK